MKVLAFAATNSLESINKKLVTYACDLLKSHNDSCEVEILDLNDYEMPLYRPDREKEKGIPNQARLFYKKIGESDKLVISFAEHNGSYTAAYKNIFDWNSRITQEVFQGRPTLLMATSPGQRGGLGALKTAEGAAPYFGMEVRGSFSLPLFHKNFDLTSNEISDLTLREQLIQAVKSF